MLTARIVNFVGGHEGFVSTWYLDPAGVPTIGYGFTLGQPVVPGMVDGQARPQDAAWRHHHPGRSL